MYALCVSGAVNTQGFVWKLFLFYFYRLYINFHLFIHILRVWDVDQVNLTKCMDTYKNLCFCDRK